ncbi:MAG: phosphoribosylformylglycinamidine cyclo-ligase [Methanomassiliicoccales archaeon]
MDRDTWTYKKAGVDIRKKSASIESLVKELKYRRKGSAKALPIKGQFTGLIDFGEVALTLCTDGVGTKLLIARSLNKWDTVGIDCIAMNVNDTICVGAEPIAVVDYLAMDRPNEEIAAEIGKGLEVGARLANVDIVGGEIAVLPEIVNDIDLSASCLGYVEKKMIIDGSKVSVGDIIIGLPSSGIHSNGLTLARKVLEANGVGYNETIAGLEKPVGEELLTPTEIYVEKVMKLIKSVHVHGMVNVTGGGLRNFVRIKSNVKFVIDDPLPPQPIFDVIAELGKIDKRELYQTFNMGMGFAVICPEDEAETALRSLGGGAKIVGRVTSGRGVEVSHLGIIYKAY